MTTSTSTLTRTPGRKKLAGLIAASFCLWGGAATLRSSDRDTRSNGVEVVADVHHDRSDDLWKLAKTAPSTDQGLGQPTSAPLSTATATTISSAVPATLNLSFEGMAAGLGWPTGDPTGAAGQTQYVQYVNASYAVFSKTGTLMLGPVPGNTLWQGFGGSCETRNDGDPTVAFDQMAGVWVLAHHATPPGGPYLQCIAVSLTSDATGQYNRYAFQLVSNYPDWPKLGIWPDAYYFTMDELDSTNNFIDSAVCAVDRRQMLAGAAATAQCFATSAPSLHSLLPSNLDGATFPPAGTPNYLLNLGQNSLNLWTFHVDFTAPANSTFAGPTPITVGTFTMSCQASNGICIPQPGTAQRLDAVSDRLMPRLAYRNFGTYQSLVVNHTVGAGGAGVRWYELRVTAGTPQLYQQGTIKPDSNSRWIGSAAMDKVGDIAIGYNVSGAAVYPGIRFNGRTASHSHGSMQGELSIIEGSGSQLPKDRNWADTSLLALDPADDCTFWYTNQYLTTNGTNNWHTRIGAFKFGACH